MVQWTEKVSYTVACLQLKKLSDRILNELKVRIHGYPSCVRVGTGCILGHQIIWAGAVRTRKKFLFSKPPFQQAPWERFSTGWFLVCMPMTYAKMQETA